VAAGPAALRARLQGSRQAEPASASTPAANTAQRPQVRASFPGRIIDNLIQREQARRRRDREAADQFIREVMDDLHTLAAEAAASDHTWRAYLRAYAKAPSYSPVNTLLANIQLRHRFKKAGIDSDPTALKLSASAWKALGRRVKEQYRAPEGKGEDPSREWDPTYSAYMTKPLGFRRFPKEVDVLDEDGNPTGEKKTIWVNGAPKGYGTFRVYHIDATEGLDGGEAPPLPKAPWANATGSEQDARQLMSDIKRLCLDEGLIVDIGSHKAPQPDWRGVYTQVPEYARLDGNVIRVDADASPADQAVAALKCLCQHYGAKRARGTDEDQLFAQAADESAKFVIASLYGLESDEQTFPKLADIAEDPKKTARLCSEVHQRVSEIFNRLDPTARARALQDAEYRKQYTERRAAKRAAQRGKRTRRRAA